MSSSNSTPPSGAPNSAPTPQPKVPNTTPAPSYGASSVDPAPLPDVPNTPTPSSGIVSVDSAPLPAVLQTTLTPTPGALSVDPALLPDVPNITTPTSEAVNVDPAAPLEVPKTTPTLSPDALNVHPASLTGAPTTTTPPSVDPAAPLEAPKTTPTLTSGALSVDPASLPDVPNIKAPPSEATNVDQAAPPEGPKTTPTPPSGALNDDAASLTEEPNTTTLPSVDPAASLDAPKTTPTPSSDAPSVDPAPPPNEVPNTTPTPPSARAPSSSPTPPSGALKSTTQPAEASSSDPTPSPVAADTTQKEPPLPPEVPTTTPTSTPAGASPTPSAVAPSGPTPPPGTTKITQEPPAGTTPTTGQRAEFKLKELKKKVLDALNSRDPETATIILHGETGVGKTWLAREIFKEISKRILEGGKESPFGATLWLSLNKKYHHHHHHGTESDQTSTTTSTRWSDQLIVEDIARQLRVLPRTEGGFEDDDDDDDQDTQDNRPEDQQNLQQYQKKQDQKEPAKVVRNIVNEKLQSVMDLEMPVLLALDDVPENIDLKKEIITKLESLTTLSNKDLLKVVITTKRSTNSGLGTFEVEPLKREEFTTLLKVSAEPEDSNRAEKFNDVILRNSGGVVSVPAAVAVLLGKALKHNFGRGGADYDDQGRYSWHEEKFLKEAERNKGLADKLRSMLIRYALDTLPSDDPVMIKCCWHSRKFFELIENASVHYNELISHWIMEGYLDEFKYSGSIEEAYKKGYLIFEELRKRGLLKVDDEDFIAMEGLTLKVLDRRREGFDETAMLGLPDVFQGDEEWQGLGKIAVADGMIKSVGENKKWKLVSTLMMDGSRLCREVPSTFFKPMKELRVLVLLNPTLKSLDFIGGGGEGDQGKGASQLSKLELLVLRGCDVLENVDSIKNLESLIVLEISGAKSLKTLPYDLFEKMAQLRSLNLSGTQVKSLPSSFNNLNKLRWLILRGCSNLEGMPSLKAFEDLRVLDMYGACSLTKFKDKLFGKLVKLRALDFSQAKIAPLPFVRTLDGLTRLTLKGCTEITRLPHLNKLTDLQFLELPGAKKLKEFYSPFLENKALRVLDLSETGLCHLPSTISNLTNLEVLNLSRMSSLEDFEGVSFSELTCLECLNLSNINVKSLPSLSGLKSLRQLFLSDCQHLEALPEIEGLTSVEILNLSRAGELKNVSDKEWKFPKLRQLLLPDCKKLEKLPILSDLHKLEELNLSGCEALKELEKKTFEGMSALEVLDLSTTKVQSLPYPLPSPKLRRLLLENCTELGGIPPLDSLSKLEELSLCGAKSLENSKFKIENVSLQSLNLSGTSGTLSSDFTKCTNLKKLSLGGCLFLNQRPQLKNLIMLEALDLSCTSIKQQSSKNHNSKKVLSLEELSEDLKSLTKLTSLDLRKLEVKEFPYWISGLVHLKSLFLPDLAGIQRVDWGQIKRLPEEINWDKCGIFEKASIHLASTRPSISIKTTKVLQSLKKHSEIWEKCFRNFRIYVCPSADGSKDEDIYRLRDESFYAEIYFKTICCPESCKRFLEIRGFKSRPEGLEDALDGVDCMSFIEDEFITSLSDLGFASMEAMTGLWLERCAKTEFIFSEKAVLKLGENFGILWASNLPLLESLYKGNVQEQSFKNLTEMYLDCCPKLEYVFSPSHLPEKLEKLQVKFCDKLETLLKSEPSPDQRVLPNLRELHLLELPKLTAVGVNLTSLKYAKVKGCPRLEREKFIHGLGLQNKEVEVTNVEENWERGTTKETKKKFRA